MYVIAPATRPLRTSSGARICIYMYACMYVIAPATRPLRTSSGARRRGARWRTRTRDHSTSRPPAYCRRARRQGPRRNRAWSFRSHRSASSAPRSAGCRAPAHAHIHTHACGCRECTYTHRRIPRSAGCRAPEPCGRRRPPRTESHIHARMHMHIHAVPAIVHLNLVVVAAHRALGPVARDGDRVHGLRTWPLPELAPCRVEDAGEALT